nr:MAG TPA: nucelotide kinase [Caudoviricetes sp.]
MSEVNHPSHYNIPGRKECIEEMLDKFGTEKLQAFCELNAYKYRYRHTHKNGREDLRKAKWYDTEKDKLKSNDDRYKIAEYFGIRKQTMQLIEEMAELTQAFCKESRGLKCNIVEEIADVRLVLAQLIYLLNCEDEVQKIEKSKVERTKRAYDI